MQLSPARLRRYCYIVVRGARKITDAIPTLHWNPDDRLTEGYHDSVWM